MRSVPSRRDSLQVGTIYRAIIYFPLLSTFLGWTTAVVRNRRYVNNRGYFVTRIVQSPNCCLSTRSRTFHFTVEVFQTVLFSGLTGALGSNLGGKRRAFARTPKARASGCRPTQGVTLPVCDSDDGVIERRVDLGTPTQN